MFLDLFLRYQLFVHPPAWQPMLLRSTGQILSLNDQKQTKDQENQVRLTNWKRIIT